MDNQKLSLFQSIPLGIGSIIGSGILFLPSLTYQVSGTDVLISWGLIILLCYPGIIFFNEMIKKLNPSNTSLSGMIELGLGKDLGNSVHIILLGTVIFGMPSAAIVAGSYCADAFEIPVLKPVIAYMLIFISIGVNLKGIKTSSNVSFVISALLVLISVYLIYITIQPIEAYRALKPVFNLNNIYSGTVLSFWAFAGFENLTFLYDKFKNPRRDLLLTIFISITVCGALYLGLVANFAAIVPYFEVKKTTGLLQMATYTSHHGIGFIIALFAVTCVLINLVSWTSGVIQMVIQASKIGVLSKNIFQSETKATLYLLLAFLTSLSFGLYSPEIFENLLKIVSTNFLLLYFLSILSYVVIAKVFYKKVLGGLICLSLLVTISSSSYILIYPFILFLVSFFKTKRVYDSIS